MGYVIDISVPDNPAIAGAVNTSDNARDVAVAGNYAYVADESGLHIAWQKCEESVMIEDDPEETTPDEEVPINALRLVSTRTPLIRRRLYRSHWCVMSGPTSGCMS